MKNLTNNLKVGNLSSQAKSIVSLYLLTLGTYLLGFTVYVFLEAFLIVEHRVISWSGEGLFWGFLLLFLAIFLLFFPSEFFNEFNVNLFSFQNLVINILLTIIFSFVFLILLQLAVPPDTSLLKELRILLRAVSFAGFTTIPIFLYLLSVVSNRLNIKVFSNFEYILILWIFSGLFFI